ncbi:hypothetical protein FGB62_11g06 [Gracilaria domingensis]|nr:hypothetical protein FGB62_11g06 [Gracilaria domingensis]
MHACDSNHYFVMSRARARIFKPSSTQADINTIMNPQQVPQKEQQEQQLSESHQSQQQSLETQFQRVVKLNPGTIAKGPVQGSTGFERRRNRRQNPSESSHRSQSLQQPPSASSTAAPSSSTQSRQNHSNENSRTSSARTRNDSRSMDSRSSSNSSMTNPHSTSARRPSAHPPEPNTVDLQDPDFDRRYDKWAVRHPAPQQPAPQPIPVPIFSQLLYPYAVQAPHHVHPSSMHLPPASAPMQQPITQYQSIVHHPSNTLMFHHAGRNGHEYESRVSTPASVNAGFTSNRAMDAGETVVATSQAFANHISASSIGAQVVQRASPTYGLDSTVDFPPLQ